MQQQQRHATLAALLRKNFVIKTRHPIALLSELLNPLLCILLFATYKSLEQDVVVPSGWATSTVNASAPTTSDSSVAHGVGWNLFATTDLFTELSSSISSLSGSDIISGNDSATTTTAAPAALANSSDVLSLATPQAMLALVSSLALPRFYFTETTMPGLLLSLALQALVESDRLEELSESDLLTCVVQFLLLGFTSTDAITDTLFAVPPECRGKVVPYKIAFTPDCAFTRQYVAAQLELWHPRMALVTHVRGVSPLQLASFRDSRVFFANESALEAYVASARYGRDVTHPKLYAAIAFHDFPQSSDAIGDPRGFEFAYALRLNATNTDKNFPASVPRTIARRTRVDNHNKELQTGPVLSYTTRGFLTIQTAVARVLNCLPEWDATAERINGSCQIHESTMTSNDPALDRRLLQQLQHDLVVSSTLTVLTHVRDAALAAFANTTSTTQDAPSSSTAALLDAMNNVTFAVDAIPAATQKQLLESLRQAPQAFHGATTFLSPVDGFHYAAFFDKIAIVFPIGFVLSYLYSVSRVIVALLIEKETRARELMCILGVHELWILVAWMLTYVQLLLVASILQTLSARALLFPHSDMGLLFAFFFSFALSAFGYGVLISSVCSRARVGSFVGMGGFFLMFFVFFAFSETASETQRTLACLLSPVALAQGVAVLAKSEAVGTGLTPANARDLIGGFRFETAIWMQSLNFVVYVLIGLYCERVVPREFGVVADAWNVCLLPASWRRALQRCVQRVVASVGATASKRNMDSDASAAAAAADTKRQQRRREILMHNCEPVSAEKKQQELDGRAVVITDLRKEFALSGIRGGRTKVAVHRLSLAFYEGQITCLLGHNGAGKSTLLAMLTGMMPPTSGDARINGCSITHDLRRVRASLGFCPQHSVLYQELTVEEHLCFYGRIKGVCVGDALTREVDKKILDVGLTEKRHVCAAALSGGMQRKLSLAIAFIGDSRVVFLDEPTSGMDPYSRRSTWELILQSRRDRVLILTTHFMDEADILGDRIAILADGELQCVGSSLFLKHRFGVGYRLSFVQTQQQCEPVAASATSNAHAEALRALIQRHVPTACVDTDVGTELTFLLPLECSPQFPALFAAIETQQQALGVLSFAISVTTLEEIFLRVAEGQQPLVAATTATATTPTTDAVELSDDTSSSAATTTTARDTPSQSSSVSVHVSADAPPNANNRAASRSPRRPQRQTPTHAPLRSFVVQVSALLRKRVLCAKRDRGMLFFSCVLPFVIIFIGLSALKMSLSHENDPKLELTTATQYDLGVDTPIPFACTPVTSQSSATAANSSATPTSNDPWCDALMQPQHFTGGKPYALPLEATVYAASTTPTVFGVSYTRPSIAPNDTTGYCLRFSELAFERGYGHNTSSSTAPAPAVDGQNGGYVLFGSARDRVLAYSVMVNSSSTHATPTYKAMLDASIHHFLLARHHQAAAQSSSSPGVLNTNATIRVAAHPFPLSHTSRSIFNAFLSLPAVLFVVIAFTFIPAAMMPFLVKEKHTHANAKHQQLLAGVSIAAYWLANFVFDVLLYVIPMTTVLLLLRLYGITSSLSSSADEVQACANCTQDVLAAVIALFVLFGAAIAPWTYVLSHVMRDPSACLLYTVMLNFAVGLLLLITSYALDITESTRAVNQTLVFLWRCSPLFTLGNGLLRVIIADIAALYGLSRTAQSAFAWDVAGTDIAYLAVECPVFFALALIVDWVQTGDLQLCGSCDVQSSDSGCGVRCIVAWLRAFVQWCWRRPCRATAKLHAHNDAADARGATTVSGTATVNDDEDVAREAQRVLTTTTATSDDVVQLRHLSKLYANGKRAIADLSFGLARGECFGFLGINGAGKTTTMQILTGDLVPTAGTATLNGFDIATQRALVRQCIGYCPQFDALLELLTVREHLEFYGRLKGFGGALSTSTSTSSPLENEVVRLLQALQLEAFEHKLAGSLSGGNKRKLSVAVALLGDPDLVFLDEPSTGMDPHARRFLWDVILRVSVQSKRTTVVLTTHSMDECEALCTTAAIMVGGRLRCFGSVPHLKARFGDGVLLECKLIGHDEAAHAALLERIIHATTAAKDASTELSSSPSWIETTQLPSVCAALGAANRIDWLVGERAAHHSTAALLLTSSSSIVHSTSSIDARAFCSWWLLEDRVEQLTAFLQQHFGAAQTLLLERQSDYCRFQLRDPLQQAVQAPSASASQPDNMDDPTRRPLTESIRLSRAFALLEAHKRDLGVQEYSIAQTSLEQIFNGFARQQLEETHVARGFGGV